RRRPTSLLVPYTTLFRSMADVKKGDVVYDLGCGDGRIVITAAKQYGATGKGFDIDPQRIKEANENAIRAGVSDKVSFTNANLFRSEEHTSELQSREKLVC